MLFNQALRLLNRGLVFLCPLFIAFGLQAEPSLRIANDTLRFDTRSICPAKSTKSCFHEIDAIGLFSNDSAQDLIKTLSTLPKDGRPVRIHFSSLGGSLSGGLRVGQVLRDQDIWVQTGFKESVCYSACAYAFMGGLIRELGPQAKFGLHQFYSQSNDMTASKAQNISGLISTYLDVMGIDRQVLQIALSTQANSIKIIGRPQAQQLRIDNHGSPFSPWKLEASSKGTLATITTERQFNRPWLLTALVSRVNGEARLMMQLKNLQGNASWLSSLSAQYFVVMGDQSFPLKMLQPFKEAQTGIYQVWFELPPGVLAQWRDSKHLHWSFVIESSDPRIDMQRLKKITYMGLNQFPSGWQALSRSQQ
jgi:hypothetical protein